MVESISDSWTDEQKADYESWSKMDIYIAYVRAIEDAAAKQDEILRLSRLVAWQENELNEK